MLSILFSTLLLAASPADSLRTETINGKLFVIHQVGEKETLFGLSKRYGASIPSILEFNPTADAGLEVGQLLKIPYERRNVSKAANGAVHKVAAKETLFSIARLYNISVDDLKAWNNLTDNNLALGQELVVRKPAATSAQPKLAPTEMKQVKTAHVVEAGETLFSISKKYSVSLQQLREWNSLTGNELKVGQTLFLVQPMYQATPAASPTTAVSTPVTAPVVTTTKPVESAPVKINQTFLSTDEVKESGLAEVIEGTEGNRKYLAFHRTAKVGSILKVKNELNNREVFVRVAAALPDTGNNDKVVIKISKSAYERLGAIDARFRVEVTYYK
jgi:LysM repeat protein